MNDVTEKKSTKVALISTADMRAVAGEGLENMGQEDMALPRLIVLSKQSDEIDAIEDATAGDLLNTATKSVYKGAEGVQVVPCVYERVFIEWAPRGTGTGAPVNIFKLKSDVPPTERDKNDNKDYIVAGDGNYIEETHQHFCLILDPNGASQSVLVSMKATQLKKSRQWNTMCATRTMSDDDGPFIPPRYSHIYNLTTVEESNAKGSWHGWKIEVNRLVEDAALFLKAQTFAHSVREGAVEVKHAQEGVANKETHVPF
jgi:hypothetical protein